MNSEIKTKLMEEAFGKAEELLPELKRHLVTDARFGQMLRHPLVLQVFYTPMLNAMMNRSFLYKEDALRRAQERGDLHSFVFLHERPFRFDALLSESRAGSHHYSEQDVAKVAMSVWADSEGPSQNLQGWSILLSVLGDSIRAHGMDESERTELDSLPMNIEIWRGSMPKFKRGLSWTLDKDKAQWFAQRFQTMGKRRGRLYSAKVAKSQVLALLNGRGEREILLSPSARKRISIFEEQ